MTSSVATGTRAREGRTDASVNAFAGSVAIYFEHMPIGGTELVLLRLAVAFARKGCKVWLVLRSKTGGLIESIPPEVELVDLNVASTFRAVLPLRRFLLEKRPDILLTAYALNNLAAVIARRLAGVETRVVLSEHAEMDRRFLGYRTWHRRVLPYLVPLLYGRADAVVGVSEGVRRDLIELGVPAGIVHVMPNPALSADFSTDQLQPVDHPWFRDRSRPIVVAVGRLSIEKDFAMLVRAFARLKATVPARLVIVGTGDQEAALRALCDELGVTEDVWMAGFWPDPSLLVSKSSVLVSSSHAEGFGLVIAEALGCGCPVVATDTAGASDILQGGRLGRLVPIGDAEAMADAIRATLAAPHDPGPGLARAATFTVEHSADSYLALFRDIGGRA
jgi:glycosyltransferase involved in cell wall biosynthesis